MLDYEIAPAEAQRRMQAETAATPLIAAPPLILDVREPAEHATARLPESVLMPMGEVSSRAHQELDPEQSIFVLCHHGVRSLSVTAWLRGQGFEKAQSIAGGIERWSTEIDPTIPKY